MGGLATAGIVAIYLPLCDGRGHQLISGISEELLKESIKYGSGEIPECWKADGDVSSRQTNRYKLRFDPPAFAYALDRLIVENNIELMLGTNFSKAIIDADEIQYCVLENKEERFAISAHMFIHASGDAALAHAAGEDATEFRENRGVGWYYSYDGDEYKLNIAQESLKEPAENVKRFYGGIEIRESLWVSVQRKSLADQCLSVERSLQSCR